MALAKTSTPEAEQPSTPTGAACKTFMPRETSTAAPVA
jgi:hypothetical protein